MRNFMNLFENIQSWPASINGTALALEAQDWHHTPEDFEDGDIFHNISAFGTFNLRNIPISDLHLGMYSIDDDLVNDYASREAHSAPPIIYDEENNNIIDGNHRANAAAQRGDDHILAYVGDPSTYEPFHADEDDEEEY